MTLQDFNATYFTIEDRAPVVVLTVVRPSLTEEDNIEQFGFELTKLVEISGRNWITLDLSQVKIMTSSAIGKLIALHRNLHRRGGRLALCGLNDFLRQVFRTSNLSEYFHIKLTVDESVESLKERISLTETTS
ncbi:MULTISPECIES: STAS domain-containing protein [unclassified Schlesneria]|uniref:STAS domain-containing protein n=1 Tax=Schlesneria TaxID=656899 RepID=UPI002F0001B2